MLLDRLYYELGFDTKASEAGLKRLYSGMTSVLGTLAKWGSIAGAVLGFAKAVNEAKKEYLEFETGARRIWTLLDVSEQELRSYTGALLDMTTKIPQSIGTLEKAMWTRSLRISTSGIRWIYRAKLQGSDRGND